MDDNIIYNSSFTAPACLNYDLIVGPSIIM